MNGGIHDAINLAQRLSNVWHGRSEKSELNQYDRQRRLVTLKSVQRQSIDNKRNLEAKTQKDQDCFRDRIRAAASSPIFDATF